MDIFTTTAAIVISTAAAAIFLFAFAAMLSSGNLKALRKIRINLKISNITKMSNGGRRFDLIVSNQTKTECEIVGAGLVKLIKSKSEYVYTGGKYNSFIPKIDTIILANTPPRNAEFPVKIDAMSKDVFYFEISESSKINGAYVDIKIPENSCINESGDALQHSFLGTTKLFAKKDGLKIARIIKSKTFVI